MWPERYACRAVLLLAVTAMAGCATLSEAECHTLDWQERGQRDGHAGQAVTRVFGYRQDCGKHGVVVDEAAWREGYQAGLVRYCTAERGYQEGRAGRSYQQVCPIDTEPRFLQGHRLGEARFWLADELARMKRHEERHEAVLREASSSDADRRHAREQLRLLDLYFLELRLFRDQLAPLDLQSPGVPERPIAPAALNR